MDALKLEKKRILKEDGRYLLFYHSAATASAEQQETFAEVTAALETIAAPAAGGKSKTITPTLPRQERADV